MLFKLALRDVLLVAAIVALWHATAGWTAGDGMLADFVGVLLGAGLGLASYLVHEWGHLAGALATRSRIDLPAKLVGPFLFSFDSKQNDLRQFLVMSVSGFVGSALVIAAYYTFLPDELLATRIARGLVLVGALLTAVLELPLVVWALLGRGLPPIENSAGSRPAPAKDQPEEPRRSAAA